MPQSPSGDPDRPVHVSIVEHRGGNGVILAIVLLALVLAVGFFYLVNAKEEHDRSQAIISAADSVDRAAERVGDAVKSGAENMKNGN
jgi:uncharacterized protein HemX